MYIPLYIKTDYSLLSSLIKIDNLINECQKNNITSVAIVDNNLFGTMEFYKKCLKNNIKPIIGLEIKIKEDTMLLYAKNEEGYKNLIKIETIKNEQELDSEILKKYSENIICIIPFQEAIDLSIYKGIFTSSFIGVSSKDEEIKAKKLSKNIVFINKTLYLEKYEYKYLPYVFMIRDGKTITEGIDFVYQNNRP